MYIELHAASAFSFLEAASLPESLAQRAEELGYPAMALLDRDGVYGLPRFHQAMKDRPGVRAITGAELTIAVDAARTWRLPLLVESQQGYRNLCRLITTMKLRAPKGEGALTLEDFDGFTSGLVALAGRSILQAGLQGGGSQDRDQAFRVLDRLVGLFGGRRGGRADGTSNVYVELQRHLRPDEEVDNHRLRALADRFRLPLLATNGVRFATPDERPLCDVL